jgi:histidinol dehydrogenase
LGLVRLLSYTEKNFADDLAAFCRTAAVSEETARAVTGLLADVRVRGDAAVAEYAARFDGSKLTPERFRVKRADLAGAMKRLSAGERRALQAAYASIVDFNRRSLPKAWAARNPHGARVGEKFDPIRRVGLYIPGGQVPLVSTVLMTATLAQLAGCPEVAAFTPTGPSGRVADGLLAALHLAGVSEVYRVGGVQAIGAMAYGTATIPAVDKVFGPGSAWVCEAKRQVFGTVGVDSLPGPSELMVIADESVRADWAAADLLAQAEHGSGREKIYLVATSPAIIAAIATELEAQSKLISRSEKTARVLAEGFLAITVKKVEQAAEIANYVAPEHLELLVREPWVTKLTQAVTTAGAIMVGNHTATALGDFTAGPSHVLPTGRAGRFFSGLRVTDFMRRTSVVRYDRAGVRRAAPIVAAFAAMEQLDAHGRSVSVRVK